MEITLRAKQVNAKRTGVNILLNLNEVETWISQKFGLENHWRRECSPISYCFHFIHKKNILFFLISIHDFLQVLSETSFFVIYKERRL